jgi:hypothetical protein
VSQVVTLHVWRVPRAALPRVLWRMARDRRRLRRTPGVSFAKLLGTGRDLCFGPADGDPRRWAALIAWDDADAAAGFDGTAVGRAWAALATGSCRLTLRPVASRGRWAGREPFAGTGRPEGLTLVLTRARLRTRQAVTFWRTIPRVGATLSASPGLLAAFGIGEAPVGWQGTVSVWRAATDLIGFAYRQPEHLAAIDVTATRRWYAEELFARFAIVDVAGERGILGWRADQGRDDRG